MSEHNFDTPHNTYCSRTNSNDTQSRGFPPEFFDRLRFGSLCALGGALIGYNWDSFLSLAATVGKIASTITLLPFEFLFPDDSQIITSPTNVKFMNGVGVIVRKGDRILVGRRLNSHGASTFAVPGGRVDAGETHFITGIRELYEETGIVLHNIPIYPQAYIHPQSHNESMLQHIVKINYLDLLEQRAQHADNTICNNHDSADPLRYHSNTTFPYYSTPITNAFECSGATLAVYVPDEHVQLMVRYIIVDMPHDQHPVLTESDKCAGWHWIKYDDLFKLAMYDHKIQHNLLYTKLPENHKEQFLKHALAAKEFQKNGTMPPCYQCIKRQQNCSCPAPQLPIIPPTFDDTGAICDPLIPSLSPDCIIQIGTDHLFAPMQALLITGFNPITAQHYDHIPSQY